MSAFHQLRHHSSQIHGRTPLGSPAGHHRAASRGAYVRSDAGLGSFAVLVRIVVLLALFIAPVAVRAQALSIEAALKARTLSPSSGLSVSPNGKKVAFTVRRAEVEESIGERSFFTSTGAWVSMIGTDIWVSDTRTGEARLLTGEKANNWAPVWSPDGEKLAYYSDRTGELGLWVWDRTTDQHHRISDRIIRTAFSTSSGPRWLPDGRGIVVKLLPADVELSRANMLANTLGRLEEPVPEQAGMPTVTTFEYRPAEKESDSAVVDRDWWTAAYGGDLAVLDATSGSVREVVEGIRPFWWEVSPDGRYLAYMHLTGAVGDRVPAFRLVLVDLRTGSEQVLNRSIVQDWGDGVSWSPDGQHLAYFSAADEALHFITLKDQRRREYKVSSIPSGAPMWTTDSRAVVGATGTGVWHIALDGQTTRLRAPDGERVQCIVPTATGQDPWSAGSDLVLCTLDPAMRRYGFARCDVAAGTCAPVQHIRAVPGGSLGSIGLPDGNLITSLQTAGSPSDLWLLDHRFTPVRRLSLLNPQSDRSLGVHRLVEWKGVDGQTARGTILLPPGFTGTERVPVVVNVYPGSHQSSAYSQFSATHQILATRGYAVFLPDMPLKGEVPMVEATQAALAGVDHLIEIGIADSTRLAVMGHSYGGYGVLGIITQTDRFRAAIAAASQGNLISNYGQLRKDGTSARITWTEEGQGRMGATPWEARERYIENSPFFFLDRVKTPLLLLHGTADPNTPVHEADASFVALRRLDREVAYARYEGEGHDIRWWNLTNKVDYWRRIVSWLDEHLRDGAPSVARD